MLPQVVFNQGHVNKFYAMPTGWVQNVSGGECSSQHLGCWGNNLQLSLGGQSFCRFCGAPWHLPRPSLLQCSKRCNQRSTWDGNHSSVHIWFFLHSHIQFIFLLFVFRCLWRLKWPGFVTCFVGMMHMSFKLNFWSKSQKNTLTRMMSDSLSLLIDTATTSPYSMYFLNKERKRKKKTTIYPFYFKLFHLLF